MIMQPAVKLLHSTTTNKRETIHNTTILQPLYRTTCISLHLQLRTAGFCWSKVLLHTCPC